MFRHMEEDMDVDCGVILDGGTIEDTGRLILERIIAVASGERTKSEANGLGDEEFAPWIVGPTV